MATTSAEPSPTTNTVGVLLPSARRPRLRPEWETHWDSPHPQNFPNFGEAIAIKGRFRPVLPVPTDGAVTTSVILLLQLTRLARSRWFAPIYTSSYSRSPGLCFLFNRSHC